MAGPLDFDGSKNSWRDGQTSVGRGPWNAFDPSEDILQDWHRTWDEWVTFTPDYAVESDG